MGSGAGSNLLNGYLLSNVTPTTAVVANPLTGYGTLGQNDSGGFAAEIRGFSKFRFSIVQVGSTAVTGVSIGIYVTSDIAAFQTYIYAIQGRTMVGVKALPFGGSPNNLADAASGFLPGIPAQSWVLAEGQADQGGTGLVANPMTPPTLSMTVSGTVQAIRACVLTAPTAGTCAVTMLGIP